MQEPRNVRATGALKGGIDKVPFLGDVTKIVDKYNRKANSAETCNKKDVGSSIHINQRVKLLLNAMLGAQVPWIEIPGVCMSCRTEGEVVDKAHYEPQVRTSMVPIRP